MKQILVALKAFSKKVAAFQTMVILTLIYILILPFFSILFHVIKRKNNKKTTWIPWNPSADTIEDLKRQF